MTKATLVENNKNNVDLVLEPIKVGNPLSASDIYDLIKTSDFSHLQVNNENIKNAIAELNTVLKPLQANQSGREIRYQILERIDATIKITIDDDKMGATGEVVAAKGGKHLSAKAILNAAQAEGVKKGFSKEDLIALAHKAAKAAPGEIVKHRIAIGIPPKNGKDAIIKPLVQSAQDRLLKPKERDDGSVDMRDLGDIVCVKVGDPLLQKIPPTKGKEGFTVQGEKLIPEAGNDIELNAGDGTSFSKKSNDVLISMKVGMPRLIDNGMQVDDVYQINNVDISTGHIKFEGSVIIKGDVHEGMKVIASGDVTIGGFVESAIIEAGGDLTIAGGVIGKKQDVENSNVADCIMSSRLSANGNLYAKYCQYTEIFCGKDMRIENQLMHSIVTSEGKVWLGSTEKSNGKLIGGLIEATDNVVSGIVGATSGSRTVVKFSKMVNIYKQQIQEVEERIKAENAKTDELRAAENKLKKLPLAQRNNDVLKKVHNTYLHHTKILATELENKQALEAKLHSYMTNVAVVASEKLYQGVEVSIGEYIDRSKREYGPSKMIYNERKIIIDPIVQSNSSS